MTHPQGSPRRRIPLILALLMLTVPLAPAAASSSGSTGPGTFAVSEAGTATLWTEDFESGAANGWSLSGMWRVTDCGPIQGTFSLAYVKPGCPTTYNQRDRTEGSAITAQFRVPATAGAAQLQYTATSDTDHHQFDDTMIVSVSADGGEWDPVYQEPRGLKAIPRERVIDLTPFAGQDVRVRFHFVADGWNLEDHRGWYVDDVRVVVPTLGALFKETFNDGTADGWTLNGLWHVDDCYAPTTQGLSFTQGDECRSYETSSSGVARSPAITIPAGVEYAQLRYGQYFEMVNEWSTENNAIVNVRLADGTWVRVHDEQGPWREHSTRILDLTPFAGETINIDFIVATTSGAPWPGWFVDDVQVLVPAPGVVDPPSEAAELELVQGESGADVTVTWKAPHDTSYVPVTGYRVYRESLDGRTLLATLPTGARAYDDAPPASGSWTYMVVATTRAGDSPEASVSVRPPPRPHDLAAEPGFAPGTVVLRWNHTADVYYEAFEVTHFRVEVDDGSGWRLAGTTTEEAFVHSGSDAVNPLKFRVRAVHVVWSGASDEVCVRALAAAPACEPLVTEPEPDPPTTPIGVCDGHICFDYPPLSPNVDCQWFPPLVAPCIEELESNVDAWSEWAAHYLP